VVVTLSQPFPGLVNDILQDVGANKMKVTAVNGTSVTCTMTTNLLGPVVLNSLLVDLNYSAATGNVLYGFVQNGLVAVAAIGASMSVNVTQSAIATVGTVVFFTSNITGGGVATVSALVTAVAPNGTAGSSPNYFNITLSIPGSAGVGDKLKVGSGATLANFTVTSVISANVVQCQMTNTPANPLIPISSATPTTNTLVYNTCANGSTTSVGSYPLQDGSSPPNNLAAVTVTANFVMQYVIPATTTIATGQIIQMTTSAGAVDIFQVVSIAGGTSGSQPSLQLQNINDVPSTTTSPNSVPAATPIYSLPELPVSRMGTYGLGRTWVALPDGISYVASDAVGSATGSQQYNYQDSVLKVSQNYFLANGGTFEISGAGETISAMHFVAQLDAALGQGPLQIFTGETVFSNLAPPDLTTWSTLTSPIQVEGLKGSGAAGQDAVIQENNDLIFRKPDGSVQSMLMATLDFNKWGNTPISNEVIRAISGDDPALIPYTSMVEFNNRMLMTCQPQQAARGVYWQGLAVLNFDPISSLAGKAPTIWEGAWNGLNVLKIISGTFDGVKQCFAICLSADLSKIRWSCRIWSYINRRGCDAQRQHCQDVKYGFHCGYKKFPMAIHPLLVPINPDG
jgi:hypothetical protein